MTARPRRDRKPKPAQGSPAPPEEPARPDRWRPWLLGACCALFVARPLFPSESAALRGDGLLMVMLWIALAVFWLLGALGRRQFEVRFGWTDGAVLLLVGLHTIAAVWATTRTSPRPAVNMLWEWVALGLSFWLARQLVASRREAKALMAVMMGLGVALGGYGLYQQFYELPATRDAYFRDPDKALREAGMWMEPGSPERGLFERRIYGIQPLATFALTNSLAGYLAPWLVVAAGVGVAAGLSRRRWRTRLAAAACGLPIAVCLYLTKSRSALLATALGVVLVAVFCRGRPTRVGWRPWAAVAALGAVLLAAVVVVSLDIDVLAEASKSLGYRVQYWRSTLAMIADHPLAGCGPGNFQDTYTRYMLPEASEEIRDPHNFLLEVWATAGTPAMCALVAVLGCFGLALVGRGRRVAGPNRNRGSQVQTGEADATPHVLAGGACGFLLSLPVGQISSAPPPTVELLPELRVAVVVLLGLPLAAAAVALLWRWIDEGPLPAALAPIGVIVLLVNLLAAGGIGFPGVAGTFWLLLVLGLNNFHRSRPRPLPWGAALAALAVAMAVAIVCSTGALNPVLRSRAKMLLAHVDPLLADKHLTKAALADPLSAEPWKQLAGLAFERWRHVRSRQAFEDFETCIDKALDLSPHSAATWRMRGDWCWRAFEETAAKDFARKAASAYHRAKELYPNNARNRASLALALRAMGDEPGFRQEAAAALRLDQLTPHADKKLAGPVRDELRKGLSRNGLGEN